MIDLINLDKCVHGALDLFQQRDIPQLAIPSFKRPLIVGSGNAAVTGKMIFEAYDAVFADESTYTHALSTIPGIDGAILISASGGKHAPIIAKELKSRGIKTILLTNNEQALARDEVDESVVFPRQTEPYTYNTSTYLSMILGHTQEDPSEIKQFITGQIDPVIPDNFKTYDAYYIMVPSKFDAAREMFLTKFDELFGSVISGRVFTDEQTKHAKTVVPSDSELFIGLGYENTLWGTHRLNIPLPEDAGYGALIAIGYYLIGHIQAQNEPYFKNNIEAYTDSVSKLFGQTISPIVKA